MFSFNKAKQQQQKAEAFLELLPEIEQKISTNGHLGVVSPATFVYVFYHEGQ